MMLVVQRGQSQDEGEPEVRGSGEAEGSKGQVGEWAEGAE